MYFTDFVGEGAPKFYVICVIEFYLLRIVWQICLYKRDIFDAMELNWPKTIRITIKSL